MSENVLETSDAAFEADVLKSDVPVLVDFWAPWCGPCKMIAPVLEELAQEYAGKVKIVKVNVDDNQETPAKFGVRGIPNLILFKDGNSVANKVGAAPKSELAALLDQNL